VLVLVALMLLSAGGTEAESEVCQALGVRVTEVKLDGPVQDIVWLTGGVAFIITKEHTLYRSADDGYTLHLKPSTLSREPCNLAPAPTRWIGDIAGEPSPT